MTFQWTAVATFLYAEIAILLLLCIPVISPLRAKLHGTLKALLLVLMDLQCNSVCVYSEVPWQKIFMFPLWSKIANYWNKAFLAIIILLIVLFLDAVREVRKYSNINLIEKGSEARTSPYDHFHMKLFRSQRNLYISGFSLFLWLVLRRTISLITQLAREMRAHVALETQVVETNEAVRKCLEENEKMQESLKKKTNCENDDGIPDVTNNKKLKQEIEELKAELKKSSNALVKTANEISVVKQQHERLEKEYDKLTEEHNKLLERVDGKNKKVQ